MGLRRSCGLLWLSVPYLTGVTLQPTFVRPRNRIFLALFGGFQEPDILYRMRRYSSFRGKFEPLEGVVGSAVYEGPIGEFLPLLCIGQFAHVGKRAVFGLGRYRMDALGL
jgi:hypothetical protein